MAQIGHRFYYYPESGEIIAHVGERQGDVQETTEAEDVVAYEIVGPYAVINYPYGYGLPQAEYYIDMATQEVRLRERAVAQ